MAAYWWYILKVSICMIAFYAFYTLLLRNSTFFLLNRLYLMLGLLLSFIIPILKFSILTTQPNSELSTIIHPFLIEPEYDFFQPQNLSNHVTTINYSILLPILYFSGISVLLFKLLFSIMRIIRTKNNSESSQIGRKKIIKMASGSPFSFFNMIFLPKGDVNQMIIEHEMVHVRQFHWFDLVLLEIISVLLWFNPIVIFYKKSLKLQHEYLADTSVIKDKNQPEKYLNCMLKHIQVADYNGIISQFYYKTIKKRIVMITKNKTSNKYLGVYLLALPLVCLMLLAFSDNKELTQKSEIAQDAVIHNVDSAEKINNNRLPTEAEWEAAAQANKNNVNEYSMVNKPSISPVDSKKVKRISGYGERINPITKEKHFHYGMDFSISEGEEIKSTAGGVVIDAKFDSKRGNYVVIQHNEVFSTLYSHLKSISVQVGDNLKKGQVIGYVGNTGFSTGAHLHYEVFENGKNVNPIEFILNKSSSSVIIRDL